MLIGTKQQISIYITNNFYMFVCDWNNDIDSSAPELEIKLQDLKWNVDHEKIELKF